MKRSSLFSGSSIHKVLVTVHPKDSLRGGITGSRAAKRAVCVFSYTRSRPKRWDAGVTGVPTRGPNDAMGKRGRGSKHGVVGPARDVGPRQATGAWAPAVRYRSLREERLGQGRRPGWGASQAFAAWNHAEGLKRREDEGFRFCPS